MVAGQIPTGTNGELGFVGLVGGAGLRDHEPHLRALRPDDADLQRRADLARLALHADRRHARPGVREADLQRPAPGLRGRRPQRRRPRVRAQRRPLHRDRRQHRLLRLLRLPADGRAARTRSATTRRPPRPTRTTPTARSCASARWPSRAPRSAMGSTYTIPAGQPVRRGAGRGDKTLPEIYAMGLRNPFTIGNAPRPTASCGSPTTARTRRWPTPRAARPATCRMIRTKQARQLRLALLLRPRVPVRATGTTSRPPSARLLRLQQPRQQLAQQPHAAGQHVRQRRVCWTSRTRRRARCGGPTAPARRRRRSRTSSAAARWPARATRSTRQPVDVASSRPGSTTATSSSTGRRTGSRPRRSTPTARVKDHKFFLPLHTFVKPMDMQFGADGALYVLAYGNGWGANNDDTGLYRVDLRRRQPHARRSRRRPTRTPARTPLTVNFDATRLDRSRRRRAHLRVGLHQRRHGRRHRRQGHATPTRRPAPYVARLTVTDARGGSSIQNFPIVVGNTRPVVKIVSPADGTPLELGQPINYKVSVTRRRGRGRSTAPRSR